MCFYKTIVNYKDNYIYLWQENDDRDSFFVENGMILRFTLEEDYQEYINENRLDVIDEDTIIHIMPKRSLLNLKDKDILRFCNEMLNVWNLAIDIKNSFTDKITILDGNKNLYDKLFYGSNTMKEDGEEAYIPYFTDIEHRQIKAVLNDIYKWLDAKL